MFTVFATWNRRNRSQALSKLSTHKPMRYNNKIIALSYLVVKYLVILQQTQMQWYIYHKTCFNLLDCIFLHTHMSKNNLKRESVLISVYMPICNLIHKTLSVQNIKYVTLALLWQTLRSGRCLFFLYSVVPLICISLIFCVMDLNSGLQEQKSKKIRRATGYRTVF